MRCLPLVLLPLLGACGPSPAPDPAPAPGPSATETAGRLIATYLRRGFRIVGEADWPDVNYASVILSKKLQP